MPNPFSAFMKEAGTAYSGYAMDVAGETAGSGLGRRMAGAYKRGFFGKDSTNLEKGIGVAGIAAAGYGAYQGAQAAQDNPALGIGAAALGGTALMLGSGKMGGLLGKFDSKVAESVVKNSNAAQAANTMAETPIGLPLFKMPLNSRMKSASSVMAGVSEAADSRINSARTSAHSVLDGITHAANMRTSSIKTSTQGALDGISRAANARNFRHTGPDGQFVTWDTSTVGARPARPAALVDTSTV